ncbi:hypothetical protein [Dongshaea marina]|uniref:hypothetical protein n=1 Tax=Dongshaea marina TaxID=2047966 RepID=UPI000D3E09E2|nr:hypothetical protein [Dongshaea marina]
MEYNYELYIKESNTLLPVLEGACVKTILINVVDPEFNVVYLETDKGVFSLQGEMGGEYLGVHRRSELPEITNQDGCIICKHQPFNMFEGKTISQARQIGAAWHGHGYEFNFEGVFNRTMIVQSIYCGAQPKGLGDCLRLGVGYYENEWRKI